MGSTYAGLAERVRETLLDAGWDEYYFNDFVGRGAAAFLGSMPSSPYEEWSAGDAIAHIRNLRAKLEHGEIGKLDFQRMRKAAALMNELEATGSLSGNSLPHYRDANPLVMLFKPDLCAGLSEAGAGVYSLAARTAIRTAESDMYKHVNQMNKVSHHLSLMVAYFVERGCRDWSDEILDEYVEKHERAFSCGEISYESARWTRTAAMLSRSVAETDKARRSVRKRGFAEPLPPAHECLVSDFSRSFAVEGLADATVRLYSYAAREFLRELDGRGVGIPFGITPADVRDSVTAVRASKGRNAAQSTAVSSFLRYLSVAYPGVADLGSSVPPPPPKRTRAIRGFDADQARMVLESPDRSTPTGMRDFAIISLSHSTGLRSVDISELRLDSIDWREEAIRIVQHKTTSPLAIPLDAEAGNAIATYILQARPDTDDPRVFIRRYRPYVALTPAAIGTIVRNHATALGDPGFPVGTSAFRRGFGTGMTEAGISLDQTKELMGHNRAGTTRGYIYPSKRFLDKCPLDLRGVENSREELL